MSSRTIRDAEGNVMYLQTTPDRQLAINVPGQPLKLRADELEQVRRVLADARAELLRGQRWT